MSQRLELQEAGLFNGELHIMYVYTANVIAKLYCSIT